MAYVLGIDIGGTFTDAFATDDEGHIASAKSHSTPPDFSRGVIDVIDQLASDLGLDSAGLLGQTSYICHGTTSTLNAVVTGQTARVGFITTRGHADSIMIMNLEGRYAGLSSEQIQDMPRANKPAPLVPRSLVREIDERVDHKGDVVVELNEESVRRAVGELLEQGVEAIAVSLLWSFRNPSHEQRVRDIIEELSPGLYVGLSSEISPRIREYPRATTTIMSTQVGPKLREYLDPLQAQLSELGFRGSLLIMQGAGGTIAAEDASRQAIATVASVLTGGVVGAQSLGAALGHKNIITTDIGGTTFLVGMIVDGQPLTSTSTTLNQHTINVAMVRINTIGSGGGAIAWVDAGGNLKVGPRSAGAHPGPACYDEGGTEPTVTDVDLLLGILDADFFLGGRKRLRADLAEQAVREHIAEPLGLSVPDAAAAVYAIQNAQTADLVRRVVVDAGHDPRDFVLYSFGGAGPVHCAAYSADLGVREIVVPLGSTAAAFSAYGLAAADVVVSGERSSPEPFPAPAERVAHIFDELEREVLDRLEGQGIPFAEITVRREADLRYTLQLAEVTTPVNEGTIDEAAVARVAADFEALYERLYGKGAGFSEAGLQIITYRVFAEGRLAFSTRLPELDGTATGAPEVKTRRPMLLDPLVGWEEADVYDYRSLAPGHELVGPAVVEAPTTTVVIPRGTGAEVDRLGNITMRSAQEGDDADTGSRQREVRV